MIPPRVTVYNDVSVDGRVTGFASDPARFYRLGLEMARDAVLMGELSARNFGPAESHDEQQQPGRGEELPAPHGFEDLAQGEQRPVLVVVDPMGHVRNWRSVQAQPFYRDQVCIVCASTPKDYLDYLDRRGVQHISVGQDSVDLVEALNELGKIGITALVVESNGPLNGDLLAEGLVDEVALILNPMIAGEPVSDHLVQLPRPVGHEGIPLELADLKQFDDGSVWLHYKVV